MSASGNESPRVRLVSTTFERLGALAVSSLVGLAAVVLPLSPAAAALPAVSGDITLVDQYLDGEPGDKVLVLDFHDATPSVTTGEELLYTVALEGDESADAVPEDYEVTMDADGNGQLLVWDLLGGDFEIREFADATQGTVVDRSTAFGIDYGFAQPDGVTVNLDESTGEGSFVAGRKLEFTEGAGAWADGVTFSYAVVQLSDDPDADPTVLKEGTGWPDFTPSDELVGKEIALVVMATLDDQHYDFYYVWWAPVVAAPDTTAPGAPATAVIGDVTSSSLTFTWSAVTDNVGVAGYDIYLNGSKVRTVNPTVQPPNTQSVTLDGLQPTTSYTVSVRAFDAAGNVGAEVSKTAQTAAFVDTQAPTAVSYLSLRSTTPTTLTVEFGPATDNVGVQSYQFLVNGSWRIPSSVTPDSATISYLDPGTSYTISVRARDSAGNWGPLAHVSGMTSLPSPLCKGIAPAEWRMRGWTPIVGTPGNDVLVGTSRREVFLGQAGDDLIDGRGGNDILCGDAGSDVLRGGAGRDEIVAHNKDRDQVFGGAGRDFAWVDAAGELVIRGVERLSRKT